MKNVSNFNPITLLINLVRRFNLVIFIVLVVGGLIVSIIILTEILTRPYGNMTVSDTGAITIDKTVVTYDQTTIDRLGRYETSTNNQNYKTLPSGRINPLSE